MVSKNIFKKVKGIAFTVFLILTIIYALNVLFVKVDNGYPGLFGYRLFRVATGSMTPVYEVGDVILTKTVDPATIEVGDDITYVCTSGELIGRTVTHRVIEEPKVINGEVELQTQGVAEGTIKDAPIQADQVIGKVITKLTILTFVYNVFITKIGLVIFIFPILFLLIEEILNVYQILRKENENEKQI